MKRLVLLLGLFVIVTAQTKNFRKVENNAFKLGEKLTFEVNYGPVTAGIATMHVAEKKKISGRDAYYVEFQVNTVPSFDPFFKVRDKYITYIDVESMFPWRFEQHIREGNYSRDFSAFFDHRKGIARTSEGSYEIPENVNDIVSAFYFLRTQDLSKMKKGDKINMQNFFKDKVHNLDVIYHGRETVSVKAGKFDCIVVEPLVKEGGLFKHEGNIIIWLTNDHRKIPVKVKTKIIIGFVEGELIKIENSL